MIRAAIVGVIALTVVSLTGMAMVATATNAVPAESLEHPEGLSLRQESATHPRGGFFLGYSSGRSHRGGGLAGGK